MTKGRAEGGSGGGGGGGGGGASDRAGRSLNTKLLGLRNATELPIAFDARGEAGGAGAGEGERKGGGDGGGGGGGGDGGRASEGEGQRRGRGSVEAGGDATFEDMQGWTKDYYGIRSSTPAETTEALELVRAARYGRADLAAELLRRFAHPDSFDPVKKRSALHAASKHKHTAIVRMLIEARANLELPTADGTLTRPLHFAAASGSMASVQALLDAGADPAAANADGRNAAGVGSAHREIQALLYAKVGPSAHSA